MNPREEIAHLTEVLERANHQYYVLDAPEMEDYEYDRLLRRLEELEAAHPELASPLSPTRRVGGEALSKFEKVEHAVPLESLQDVFSPAFPLRWNMWTARSSAVQRAATAASART